MKKLFGHPVFQNALALYVVQIADYVLPMLTIPYLARVLQPEGWGLVLYTQAFAIWLGLIFEYGFTLSVTREIARLGGAGADRTKVGELVSGVAGASLVLTAGSVVICLMAGMVVPEFRRQPHLLWTGWALAMVQGLRPMWYFQAIEKQRLPSALTLAGRLVFTGLVFMLVRDRVDAYWVLYLQLISGLSIFLILAVVVWRQVQFPRPTWPRTVHALRLGWSMFLFRSAVSLYTSLNTFLLGWFVPAAQVAFFGGPERLMKAAISGLSPLTQALYPRMARMVASDRKSAGRMARLGLLGIGGMSVFSCVLVVFLAPWMVKVALGSGYEPAIPVLQILALQLPLIGISNVLGIQWMLPLGMDAEFNRIILMAGLLNLCLAVPFTLQWGPSGMAISAVAAEVFVVGGQWYAIGRSPHTFWKESSQ